MELSWRRDSILNILKKFRAVSVRDCCFLRMSHAKTMFLITFYIHFWLIFSQFWVDLRVPGGSLGQLEARLAPPSTQGWLQGAPGTQLEGQKPSQTIRKTRFFIKSEKKKSFSFQTREQLENWAVMLVKLLFSRISLPKKSDPSNFQNTLNGALV